MNRWIGYVAVITGLLVLAPGPDVCAATTSRQALYDKIDRVLVTVRYKAQMTYMGESEDIEGRVMGLSVGPDGLIIFDGTTLGTGAHFATDGTGMPRVGKPTSLTVTDWAGKTYEAEFIGVDQYSSIAFCRLPDSANNAIAPAVFDQVDLSLGDKVLVFWMLPENFQPRFQVTEATVTTVLTQPEKYYLLGELPPDFIMAPVVSQDGKLLGVVTPVTSAAGGYDGYSGGGTMSIPVGIMPVEQLKKILAAPPMPGDFKQGWMGISLQALDPEIASFWNITVPGGIIVSDVIPRSPAEKAGLKMGDFIVALDGKPLEVKKDAALPVFQKMVSEQGAGAKLDMTVLRPSDEKVDTLSLTLVLDRAPVAAGDAPSYEDKNFDVTVRDLVFADYNSRNLDPDKIKGVMVDKLEAGGWADIGGLDPGDIVMKINDQTVVSVKEAKDVFSQLEKDKGREVVFMVWRNNKTQFVNVKTHWE
jgi:S1-C subfamily serine protease